MANQGSVLSMKLLIDKANKKVLFAEAGKECVDFFFHILSLPLATIVSFLTKESMVGSIGHLYASLESLSTDYILSGVDKYCLLNPHPTLGSSSQVPLLTTKHYYNPIDSAPKHFYTCINTSITTTNNPCRSRETQYVHKYVTDAAGASCPQCDRKLDQELCCVPPPELKVKPQSDE